MPFNERLFLLNTVFNIFQLETDPFRNDPQKGLGMEEGILEDVITSFLAQESERAFNRIAQWALKKHPSKFIEITLISIHFQLSVCLMMSGRLEVFVRFLNRLRFFKV